MKKKFIVIIFSILSSVYFQASLAQTTTNKIFSFGSYGRIGAGVSPGITGNIGRSLNLNGMGSIGGRMEEADYVELLSSLHFKAEGHDTTLINVQARMALYSGKGQLIGNVSSSSAYGGVTLALPELYVEALNIRAQNGAPGSGQNSFAVMMCISPTIFISMITARKALVLSGTKQQSQFYFPEQLTLQVLFRHISI